MGPGPSAGARKSSPIGSLLSGTPAIQPTRLSIPKFGICGAGAIAAETAPTKTRVTANRIRMALPRHERQMFAPAKAKRNHPNRLFGKGDHDLRAVVL